MSSEPKITPCPQLNTLTWVILGIALLIILGLIGAIVWLAYSKSKITAKTCPSNPSCPSCPSLPDRSSIPSTDKCLIESKTFANTDPDVKTFTIADLTGVSQKGCQHLCLGLDECQAWTYDSGDKQCYLRSAANNNGTTITTGFNTGSSECAAWTRYPSSDFSFNGVSVGNRTSGITEPSCQQQCENTTNCDFYTFNTTDNSCNTYQMSANSQGSTTGIKLQIPG